MTTCQWFPTCSQHNPVSEPALFATGIQDQCVAYRHFLTTFSPPKPCHFPMDDPSQKSSWTCVSSSRQLIHAPDTTTLCTLNPAVVWTSLTNKRDFRSRNLWFQYADGFAYSKHKMEEAFRPGGFLEKVAPKPPAVARDPLKREDVDLIVRFFSKLPYIYTWAHGCIY